MNLIGAGVRCGQPTEEALVRGGRVLTWSPVTGHIVRVGDHQLSSVQVGTEDEGDILHPVNDGTSLRRHLKRQG